jgi:hypothetical protein
MDPPHKLSQLDADVHAIYALLDDLHKDVRTLRGTVLRQATRLDQIEADLTVLIDQGRTTEAKLDVLLTIITAPQPEDPTDPPH